MTTKVVTYGRGTEPSEPGGFGVIADYFARGPRAAVDAVNRREDQGRQCPNCGGPMQQATNALGQAILVAHHPDYCIATLREDGRAGAADDLAADWQKRQELTRQNLVGQQGRRTRRITPAAPAAREGLAT